MSKHVIAYHTEANAEHRVDLQNYGVRPEWPPRIIWDVAEREMRHLWGKPCTRWEIEEIGT